MKLTVNHACLYFHSPCFDGIVSAVLTVDFLQRSQNWTFDELRAVSYESRSSWLSKPLQKPFAIVDFLYHPDAEFWADHHQTSFLKPSLKEHYLSQKNPYYIYSSRSGSCAKLLWRVLKGRFKYRNKRFAELVKWADKIDSARYDSVEEAIAGSYPALNITRTLIVNKDPNYCAYLVNQLLQKSLDEVGCLREIVEMSNEAKSLAQAGLDRLAKTIHLEESDIAVFDVDSSNVLINRYAPYYFFPNARYSVGMVRTPEAIKITAMRNPWRQFPSIYLGKVFERFGGGGHRRVGSVLLRGSNAHDAEQLMKGLLREIRKEESNNKNKVAA